MLKSLTVSLGFLCLGNVLFAQDTIVRFKTSFGDIDVQMFRSSAPLNVEKYFSIIKIDIKKEHGYSRGGQTHVC